MAEEFTQDDDDLLAELGVEIETKKIANRTPREERIIAGFEEIQRFTKELGRAPQHGVNGRVKVSQRAAQNVATLGLG